MVGSILAYFLFVLLQLVLIQTKLKASVIFIESYAECVFYASEDRRYPFLYFVGYTVPFIVPMFVVFVSTVCTIYVIAIKPKYNDSHTQALATSSSRVTSTILLFTLAYAVFNIPVVIDRVLVAMGTLYPTFESYNFPHVDYYLNFTYSISVACNSACNPWLYAWRMRNFREHLVMRVKGIVHRVQMGLKGKWSSSVECSSYSGLNKRQVSSWGENTSNVTTLPRSSSLRKNTNECGV